MKQKFTLSLALLFAFVLVSVLSAPLEDLSVTSVDLAEEPFGKTGSEHLYVTVTRTDDLVDDDGSLLAERVVAVRMTFDVIENQLHCNGVPVDIGVSNIEVEAEMAANPKKISINSEEDLALLEDTFDVGLVSVEVTVSLLDEFQMDDIKFRRLLVQERIKEINGKQAVQTDAGQQILDVFDTGMVNKWGVDPVTGHLLPGSDGSDTDEEDSMLLVAGEQMNPSSCAGRLVSWWQKQSKAVRCVITGSFIAVLFAIALAIRQMIISSPSAGYSQLAAAEPEHPRETIWDAKDTSHADNEEKRPFLS